MNSPQSVGRGARPPMNTESILTEQKKQEMKTALISLTNYLERLEKYLKHKYNTYDVDVSLKRGQGDTIPQQTNNHTNNINNTGNSSL
jgi:hypothetical protein